MPVQALAKSNASASALPGAQSVDRKSYSKAEMEEFQLVKNKFHSFFANAETGKSIQPLVISEKELNSFLKHDRRLGVLCDTISAQIKDGHIHTVFDINLGSLSLLGDSQSRLKGMGSFRIGMYGSELKVAVESLNVNNSSVLKWMQYAHNTKVRDLAKNGLKSIASIPLKMLGKAGFQSKSSSEPVLATFDLSRQSTGNVFEALNYQGDGALNWLAEPVQLFTLNELFDVHSRLRDLVNALDRVEVVDGLIHLYPRNAR
jgi:hypothetical protein